MFVVQIWISGCCYRTRWLLQLWWCQSIHSRGAATVGSGVLLSVSHLWNSVVKNASVRDTRAASPGDRFINTPSSVRPPLLLPLLLLKPVVLRLTSRALPLAVSPGMLVLAPCARLVAGVRAVQVVLLVTLISLEHIGIAILLLVAAVVVLLPEARALRLPAARALLGAALLAGFAACVAAAVLLLSVVLLLVLPGALTAAAGAASLPGLLLPLLPQGLGSPVPFTWAPAASDVDPAGDLRAAAAVLTRLLLLLELSGPVLLHVPAALMLQVFSFGTVGVMAALLSLC